MATPLLSTVTDSSPEAYDYSVFINCPFDPQYLSLLRAMAFTIQVCGFEARCAQEEGTQYRFLRILDFIEQCRYSVHDLMRSVGGTEPRNNMPLELGVCIGSQRFGSRPHEYLVLVKKAHDHKKVLSDLGGEDPTPHGGREKGIIRSVRDWLAGRPTVEGTLPGPEHIADLYDSFKSRAPELAARHHWRFTKKTSFPEFITLTVEFLEEANQYRQELADIEAQARAAALVQ
jgi:hypothetical protein